MGRAIRPSTIVVVEEEPNLRALAATLFEESDLVVREFERADEAWDYIQRSPGEVAVLFSDVTTPGDLDGFTLGERCTARFPWIRVIVTSGQGLPKRPEPGLTFLPKPWVPLDLLRAAEFGRP